MSRPKRYEFQGAIHLVTVTGNSDGCVFYSSDPFTQFSCTIRSHAPDAEHFEALLWETCDQYGARVHAYHLEPNVAFAIIQTYGAPLSWIMHDQLSRFSMHLIRLGRFPAGKRPFPTRYKAQLVQPAKLPYAVRYVHRSRTATDPRRRAINHPFSSSLIYGGRRPRPPCVLVSPTRETLQDLGYLGTNGYFEFMGLKDSPTIALMLAQNVIGDARFREWARNRKAEIPRDPQPNELLREITGTLLHSDSDVARSSTRRGGLARALVAWYAMRAGTAQIAAVGKWFGVTSSDLRYLIRRHREDTPQYFSKPLSEVFPTLAERVKILDIAPSQQHQRFARATVTATAGSAS